MGAADLHLCYTERSGLPLITTDQRLCEPDTVLIITIASSAPGGNPELP